MALAVNFFHQCLVPSGIFAGSARFLAGLFTFLSRRPIVNQLRASERNWFKTVVTITKKSRSEEALFHHAQFFFHIVPASTRLTLLVHACLFCFLSLPNSDMDYRKWGVRACMCTLLLSIFACI